MMLLCSMLLLQFFFKNKFANFPIQFQAKNCQLVVIRQEQDLDIPKIIQ